MANVFVIEVRCCAMNVAYCLLLNGKSLKNLAILGHNAKNIKVCKVFTEEGFMEAYSIV